MQSVNLVLVLCFCFMFAFAQNESENYSGKQTQEWSEVQTKLGGLKMKLDTQDTVVKNLIIEKNSAVGTMQAQKIEELKKEYHKLQVMITDYNQLNTAYETKFPERGLNGNRIYRRVDPKSIERIENDMTLDGRLMRLQTKVLSQYPKTSRKIENEKAEKRRAQKEKAAHRSQLYKSKKTEDSIQQPVSGDVTAPLILRK